MRFILKNFLFHFCTKLKKWVQNHDPQKLPYLPVLMYLGALFSTNIFDTMVNKKDLWKQFIHALSYTGVVIHEIMVYLLLLSEK